MKRNIKRIFVSLISVLILLVSLLPVFAVSGPKGIDKQMKEGWNTGEERIDVRVDLSENGTAHISEYWAVNVDEEWSEMYIPMTHMNGMEIKNLKVENETSGETFETLEGPWNTYSEIDSTNEKRDLKDGKCGLHPIDGGNEICWGVSNSGYNVYKLDYDLTNAVKAYEDGKDGFHIRFINDEMNIDNLSAATVIIGMANGEKLTRDNTKIWAFGLEGDIQVKNGVIVCLSKTDGTINFCNVMASFDPELFQNNSLMQDNNSFEDVKNQAFEGSDYSIGEEEKKPSMFKKIGRFILRNIVFIIIFLSIVLKQLFGRKIQGSGSSLLVNADNITNKEKKHDDYTRDIPMHGSKAAAVTTIASLDNYSPTDSNIIAAYLLHFLQLGIVKSHEGKRKKDAYLTVVEGKESVLTCDSERVLYNILLSAADANGKLDSSRMRSYGNANTERMKNWYKGVKKEGKNDIISYGYTEHIEKKKGLKKEMVDAFNEEGKKEALKYRGLENFFKDFTLLNEREMSDVGLWKDYLVYATMLGVSKKVAKEMNNLLPDYFENPEKYGYSPYAYSGGYTFFDYYILSQFASNLNHGITAEQQAARSAGSGGATSLGGGGGFSGGGSGGGGR